jgi:uncharacterized membrane protein YtjA (UPF0391 family)
MSSLTTMGEPNAGMRRNSSSHIGEHLMLRYALIFLVIAIIAAVFGFGGIAGASAGIAQILFYIFLLFLVISLVLHLVRGRGV